MFLPSCANTSPWLGASDSTLCSSDFFLLRRMNGFPISTLTTCTCVHRESFLYCTAVYCTLRGQIKGTASAVPVIARFTWGCMLYSTAHDNGDSCSLSYTRNKTGRMQSTINQLKGGKGRAVRAIMVLGLWSR